MRGLIVMLASFAILAGCSSRVRYHQMPPVTTEKKPFVDIAPKETGGRMKARALSLKKRIAVARFGDIGWVEDVPFERDKEIVAKQGGPERVTEALITALHKTGRFDIVERKNIEELLKEIKFGESKWVDKTAAAKAGDSLGAQCIIFVAAGRIAATHRTVVYLRMVDVSTSRVTAAVKGAGGDLDDAVVAASQKLVKLSEQAPWVGKIAKIETEGAAVKEILIDSGKDLGVKADDTFAVFSLGEAVKDPDSGKILGYREEGAGVIRIVEVKDRFSVAKPVTLTREIKIADLIRPAIEE